MNIHGAIANHWAWAKIDLETGQTRIREVLTVDAMLGFLKEGVPRNWGVLCDDVSDNFRVISPKDF